MHLLPDINNLIKTTFRMIKNPDGEIIEACNQNIEIDIYFYKVNNNLYYLPSSVFQNLNHIPLNELPWLKTKTVFLNKSFPRIIDILTVCEVVLIIDESESPVGYLDSKATLKEIFKSYTYLKAYFDSIIETMEESVSIIDENKITRVWTKGAERIFSIKKEDILGKPMDDFFATEKLKMVRALKTGESFHHSQSQPRDDIFLLVNINHIQLDGKNIGVVCAETDISNEIRLHQELFDTTKKIHQLRNEIVKLTPSENPFHMIKGKSESLNETINIVKKIASTSATCLIQGESGVGKELFAKAIHDLSEQKDSPFIAINCGAIPQSLFESELFGYEKGAFTGANSTGKKGQLELARGGTLFLDEVGELPIEMQVKLLRVLQDKKYYPVGSTKQIEIDFRVIAATNRNLMDMISLGTFREDLYYRLNVISLYIPPLRERPEDIIELTKQFLYEFTVRYNRFVKDVPDSIMEKFLNFHWPGNIRELRNVIERLVVFSTDGTIKEEDLPLNLLNINSRKKSNNHSEYLNSEGLAEENIPLMSESLQKELDLFEKKIILQTLSLEDGNKQSVAKRLGISRSTLYYKLNKLGIN